MKSVKLFLLCASAAFIPLNFSGCGEVDPTLDTVRRIGIFFESPNTEIFGNFEIDGVYLGIEGDLDMATRNDHEIAVTGDVSYTYEVKQWDNFGRTIFTYSTSGTLNGKAFLGGLGSNGALTQNFIKVVADGTGFKLLVNGKSENKTTGTAVTTGYQTSASCVVGNWKIGFCGSQKGEAFLELGSDGKGKFKKTDCNNVCGPLTFTFSYTMSGTTCNFTYDALQPLLSCNGIADTRTITPNPASRSMQLLCGNNTLTVDGVDEYAKN